MNSSSKDRNHDYLYTVETRHEIDKPVTDDNGNVKHDAEGNVKTMKVTEWVEVKVTAFNIDNVAGKLHLSRDDIRYKHKEVIK